MKFLKEAKTGYDEYVKMVDPVTNRPVESKPKKQKAEKEREFESPEELFEFVMFECGDMKDSIDDYMRMN